MMKRNTTPSNGWLERMMITWDLLIGISLSFGIAYCFAYGFPPKDFAHHIIGYSVFLVAFWGLLHWIGLRNDRKRNEEEVKRPPLPEDDSKG